MYKIVYHKRAENDLSKLKSTVLGIKAKELIEIIRQNPFRKPPVYASLLGNFEGFFSRRINIQHRLVYQVYAESFVEDGVRFDGVVKIVCLWIHYEKI